MLARSKTTKKRSWKMERATVHHKGTKRPRSNKYSSSDAGKKPSPHSRKRVWVGSYSKQNGTHVKGYYRANAQY